MAIEWVSPEELTVPEANSSIGRVVFCVSDSLIAEMEPYNLASMLTADVQARIEGLLAAHPVRNEQASD